jgi:hypothetical protein
MLRVCLQHAPEQARPHRSRSASLRHFELVALEVADLTEAPSGPRVRIRRKTDKGSAGRRAPL